MIEIENVSISKLKPAAYNPRKIDGATLDRLARGMEEFGIVDPIIINKDGTVIGGHQRIKAAEKLGLSEVPCVRLDLDKTKEKTLNLALNKISGEWDMGLLKDLLIELDSGAFDIELTGFSAKELEKLMVRNTVEDDFDAEAEAGKIKKAVAKPGDVWVMDRHRLCCGDATNPQDYEKLMAGALADLVWADPPYGVSYTDKTDWINNKRKGTSHKPIAGDNLRGGGLQRLLEDAFKNTAAHSKPGACVYVAHADINTAEFRGALTRAGIYVSQTLVWVKSGAVLSRNDYNWKHEPILYGWNEGAGHYFSQNFTETSVIDDDLDLDKMKKEDLIALLKELRSAQPETVLREDRPTKNALHPTMKPIALVARMIRNSTRPDPSQIVLDPFMGSGTTLMAAEQTGRTAYGIELDPVYCDVICKRWEAFTGKVAKRENDAGA